jgi:hypothetical protein
VIGATGKPISSTTFVAGREGAGSERTKDLASGDADVA